MIERPGGGIPWLSLHDDKTDVSNAIVSGRFLKSGHYPAAHENNSRNKNKGPPA
jgi:hypothetical protein